MRVEKMSLASCSFNTIYSSNMKSERDLHRCPEWAKVEIKNLWETRGVYCSEVLHMREIRHPSHDGIVGWIMIAYFVSAGGGRAERTFQKIYNNIGYDITR